MMTRKMLTPITNTPHHDFYVFIEFILDAYDVDNDDDDDDDDDPLVIFPSTLATLSPGSRPRGGILVGFGLP